MENVNDKKWTLVNFCEFDKYAIKSYCAIHNVDESLNLGDITKVDETKLESFNMICGGSPCFAAGTQVFTNQGYKPIEDIKVGDKVLTHTGGYNDVVKIGSTEKQPLYELKAQGILSTKVTGNHPYYVRTMNRVWNNKLRRYERVFSDPYWKTVDELNKNDYIGVNILSTNNNIRNVTKTDCYLIGRYVADGYIRNGKRSGRKNSYNHIVTFCVGKHKIDQFNKMTKDCNYHIGITEERTVYKCRIINEYFMNLCLSCGKGAENKCIPNWIMELPNNLLKSFIDGYMSGDGCYTQKRFTASTVSEKLANSLVLCIAKVYHVGACIYYTKRKPTCIIEGRIVNQKNTYQVTFATEERKQDNYKIIDNIIWYPVKSVVKTDELSDVYNLEVKDSHSYTANNAIVHNCQDFSVAGKQKGSVWTCKDCGHEYNPLTVHWSERDKCPNCHSENIEKTRSSLLVEYLRVVRANKPNFGMYENVKNIVGKQFKDTFKMFTDELDEYGYNVYWKVLNAKDYGVPQNRERVYLIFIKKELDNGSFKFPEPFDNGIRLKDILEDEVDEKYYISEEKLQRFITNLNNDSSVLYDPCQVKREEKSRDYKDPRLVNENAVKQVGNIVNTGNWDNPQRGRIYSPDGCSPALNTCSGGGLEPKIIQVGNINPSGKGMNGNVFSDEGLAPTLTTNKGEGNKIIQVGKINSSQDGVVVSVDGISPTHTAGHCNTPKIAIRQATKQGYIECEIGGVADLSYPNSKTRRGRVQDGGQICPTITATETGVCKIESSIRIRKLTPTEAFRLQGFSYQDVEAARSVKISNSQLYKQAGNSIVVDVLYYILVELYKAMPYLFDDLRLSSFFSGIGAFEKALDRLYESINSGNFTNPPVQ